jgi:Permuted papain-like amidase enzyme, YaeF/YiiX, C92 family
MVMIPVITDAKRPGPPRRPQWQAWLIWGLPALCALPILVLLCRPVVARWIYKPKQGDIVFQSLPPNRLSIAIEGATHSSYSHCGIVARRDGRWVVIEAYRGVEETPLMEWLARGQGGGFVVYRLRSPHDQNIPALIADARSHLGKPYDSRYQWDDERIYCSELVFKAYLRAGRSPLGKLVRLGDLDWRPYRETIEHFEGSPAPLEREMITPRDLAKAEQLEEVCRFGL